MYAALYHMYNKYKNYDKYSYLYIWCLTNFTCQHMSHKFQNSLKQA